ncbi:hypothetical protein [Paraburkholderia sp. 32]|uniref:hypothetical protein n=1 Tax=Paraburkholderia sp. 32 TaxID=2991057 RepID=UPI003D1DB466
MFLLEIANKLLLKADRSVGERNVRLRLDEKTVPKLFRLYDGEAIRVHQLLIEELARTGWIKLHLSPEREFSGFLERTPMLELVDFAGLASWASFQSRKDTWDRQLLAFLRRVPDAELAGRRDALIEYLSRNPLPALQGLSHDDALACIKRLAALCGSTISLPLRELSALVFHARSKVLDNRVELLKLLGAEDGQFYEGPVQLLVAAPRDFTHVVFVENLVTFERMADENDPRWCGAALVFASGFKGSARRLRSRRGSAIYFRTRAESDDSSVCNRFSRWLYGDRDFPVSFFGDLDFAGMGILRSLRDVFPGAGAWLPGYHYLAQVLCLGGGHLPEMADKDGQIGGITTGCDFSDAVLMPLMSRTGRFVDQEAFVVSGHTDFPACEESLSI